MEFSLFNPVQVQSLKHKGLPNKAKFNESNIDASVNVSLF